ncbi:MAG: BLUF domain-containing protein [Rhodobacteraceae bacterium]|nr:BLUF domain-containing protein [Paracoccaceae bacterium]
MFVQTIYESRITGSFRPLVLLALQKTSVKRNCEAGVTSFLFHDKERIFQVLEGTPEAVTQIAKHIRESKLHTDIKVRASMRCKIRSFPHWFFGATSSVDPYFKRAYGALHKQEFFNLDVVEAVQILQIVASRKRRSVKMDQFSVRARNFKTNRTPHALKNVRKQPA